MLATIFAYGIVIMSALGFVLTVTDRILARNKKKRIPEALLLIVACALGAVGVMLGFFLAKRDYYKQEIRLSVPAIAVGEVILLFWMIPGFFDALKAVFA